MGGRSSDAAGSDFTHPFEYDPVANTWTTKSATYPDNQVNNMACGVLNDAGTDYIYCVGGSAGGPDHGYRSRLPLRPCHRRHQPGCCSLAWCHGHNYSARRLQRLQQQALYPWRIRHPLLARTINQIWEFTPSPAGWVQKTAVLPVPRGYIPTTTIGSLIYTGGGSDITAGVLTDTTDSFVYNPVADTISTIAPIPRATAETRALNFCNQMYVMGGGRTAPNPSNEVNIYDPVTNTWSLGQPFVNARRNFPTDTDGTNRIWLAGGYDAGGAIFASMEIFTCPVSPCGPSPTPTPTATATATATATGTPTATPAPRTTPTPRPRPTPPPRP